MSKAKKMSKLLVILVLTAFCILASLGAGGISLNAQEPEVELIYTSHVQKKGWLRTVAGGKVTGLVGKGLRIEALSVGLKGQGTTGAVNYSVYVSGMGWTPYVKSALGSKNENNLRLSGNYAGSVGKKQRIENVRMYLTGAVSKNYSIYYRVYVSGRGWTPWTANNSSCAASDELIECVQARLVKKAAVTLTIGAYVGGHGWCDARVVTAGNTASGYMGIKGMQLQSVAVRLDNGGIGGDISFATYKRGSGWSADAVTGDVSGTPGQVMPIEAVRFALTGNISNFFNVYYRAFVTGYGWSAWAANGDAAGAIGIGQRVEAYQIYLKEKGTKEPSLTEPACKYAPDINSINGSYRIMVNKATNVVTIYKGGVPVKAMLCSTGADTPVGMFTVSAKWKWLSMVGNVYGKFVTQFYGNFLFHSVPYTQINNHSLQTEEYNKLGTQCSHGCVRLCVEDAKWIYDNIPYYTSVSVIDSAGADPLPRPVREWLPSYMNYDPTDPEA